MHIYQMVPWMTAPFEPKKKPVKERKSFAGDESAATDETGTRRPQHPVDDDDAEQHKTDILA
jgi:hypothetical protein